MKRTYLILCFSLLFLLTACVRYEDGERVDDTPKQDVVEEDTTNEDDEEDQSEENSALDKIELSDESELLFTNFTVEIKEAETIERDGSYYLKINILYTNDSFPEEKAFMAAVPIFSVKQNDNDLDETSGVMTDPNSNYYYKNEPGIWAPIEFEFELINLEDDVTLSFTSLDYGDPETYMIELN